MTGNFTNLMKKTAYRSKELSKTQVRSIKELTSKYIIIKLPKTEHKERILKVTKGRRHVTNTIIYSEANTKEG